MPLELHESIRSRAHRCLKPLANFQFVDQELPALYRIQDGWIIKLPVRAAVVKTISGDERRFPDLYEVLRYFLRVLGRIKLDQSPKG